MSNATMTEVSDADLITIYTLSIWIGYASPNFKDYLIMDIWQKIAEWCNAMNNSITPEDVTAFLGTKPSEADRFLNQVFFGPEDMGVTTNSVVDEYKPILPHPANTTVVIPIYIAFAIVTAFIMALRLWSRFKVAGGIRSFDWLAVAGFFLSTAWGALAVWHTHVSTPYQAYYDLKYRDIARNRTAYLALTMFYPWVMMVIKFSLLLFYYRMTKWNYIKWSCWGTAVIVAGVSVASLVLYTVIYPRIDNWNHPFDRPRINRRTLSATIASIYIFTDVIIWVMPMPLVFQLKLYPRERILALITFSLGAVACVASCIRLDAVLRYDDFSAKSSSTLLIDAWTIIELYLTLICSSAPALRALAIHYAPKVLNTVGSAAFSSAATTSTTVAKKTSASSNTSVNTDQKGDVKTKVTSELDDLEKEVEKEYAKAEREAEREAQKEAERLAQEQAEKDAQNEAAPQAVEKQA